MADGEGGGYRSTVSMLLLLRSTIDEVHRHLAEAGYDDVRPAHGFAFQRLAPNGASGNELAEHLGITKQAASEMIDYLEGRGYVARRPNPTDGRGKIVELTARGWACVAAGETAFTAVERRWEQVLGADRVASLLGDLRRLVDASGVGTPPLRLRPVW